MGSELTCWGDGCGFESVSGLHFYEIVIFSKVGDLNFVGLFFNTCLISIAAIYTWLSVRGPCGLVGRRPVTNVAATTLVAGSKPVCGGI